MKIYLDLLMILNFFIDFLLLLTVCILLKRKANIIRIIFGAFIGGLSILLLFININNYSLFLYKLVISILMVLVTFKFNNIKYTLLNLFYLYIVSIVLGGFLYFINIEFSYKKVGIVFINNGYSINLIILILISPLILYIYIKQNNKIKYNYNNYYDVILYVNNRKYKYIGYMDTGNTLTDSLTNKPVILIDKRKILFNIKQYRLISYQGVNSTGLIKISKISRILFNGKEYNNILLGIIDNICIDGVDIILNRKLMEEL